MNLFDLYVKITTDTSDVEKGVKETESSTKKIKGSFKEAGAGAETLKNRISVLEKQYEDAKKQVDNITEAFNKSVRETGTASKETQDLATTLKDAESRADSLSREIDNLSRSEDDASDKTVSFGDILKSNLVASAIIDGVKAIAGAVKNMAGEFISSAASVKAETSQFEQTFGEFRDQASEAIGRVADESGILQTRLNTLGSKIFAFARSSGGDVDESMSLMERALRAAADSAAYYDTSVEDATETLQSFLKGNFENDAALGLSATETTRNAAAMELFGQKYNDLTEIQKQETLLKMVEDSQRLSGAMGQAARESDGWENVMGNLNEVWRQFQAKIGSPVLENLIPIVQDVTSGFQDWMNNVDWDGFGESINSFVTTIIDNGPTIISVISGIAAGLIAWNVVSMIQGVVTAINAFKTANEGASIAQLLLNAAMNANPIAIVITVVAALVTAVITLWNTNEDFRNAVIRIWESIKKAFSDAWKAIAETFSEWGAFFSGLWNSLTDIFSGVWNYFVNIGTDIVNGIWNGIESVWNSLVDWFSGLWDSLFGNRSVNVNVNQNSNVGVHGSHASGLSYVPFDGYIAELHRGERVLTAREASQYRGQSGGNVFQIYQQPGEDGEALAHRVAEILQTGTERREAAIGFA